jgi:cell division septum initiation protein DivIVA
MARGIGGLMKAAAGSVAQVPGAEEIVLAAVRDIFKELKQLRRENARLKAEIDRLNQRIDRGGRKTASTGATARRVKPASHKRATTRSGTPRSRSTTKRAPERSRGLLRDLLG